MVHPTYTEWTFGQTYNSCACPPMYVSIKYRVVPFTCNCRRQDRSSQRVSANCGNTETAPATSCAHSRPTVLLQQYTLPNMSMIGSRTPLASRPSAAGPSGSTNPAAAAPPGGRSVFRAPQWVQNVYSKFPLVVLEPEDEPDWRREYEGSGSLWVGCHTACYMI